jgi:hypothetical protein
MDYPAGAMMTMTSRGRRFLRYRIARAGVGGTANFERIISRMECWRSLTRRKAEHLQVLRTDADGESMHYLMEPPDTLPGSETYVPTTLSALVELPGRIPAVTARAMARAITEGLDLLLHGKLEHGAIRASNIFLVDGRPRLGPPSLEPTLIQTRNGKRDFQSSDVMAAIDLVEMLLQDAAQAPPSRSGAFMRTILRAMARAFPPWGLRAARNSP